MVSNKKLIHSFFHIGVEANQAPFIQKKIIIANYLAVILMFFPILFGIIAYIFFPPTLFIFFISFFIPPITIFFNYIGLHVLGRLILGVLPTLLGVIFLAYVVQGEQTMPFGNAMILFSFVTVSFVLFDIREIFYAIFCLLVSFASFLYFPVLDVWLDISMNVEVFYTDSYNYMNVINSLVILFICFAVLQKINLNSEKQNKKLITESKMDNQNLEKQQYSLNQTLEQLRKAQAENHNQNWAIRGINLINQVIQQNNNSETLYDEIIKEISRYLGVLQAGFYLVKEKKRQENYLSLEATFALNEMKFKNHNFLEGEGLVGEAWKSKEKILVKNTPTKQQPLDLGIIQLKVNTLLMVPIIANAEVVGVFEFYFGQKPAKYQVQFVETISKNVALMVEHRKYQKD